MPVYLTKSIIKHLQLCTWKGLKIITIQECENFKYLTKGYIFKMVTFPNYGLLPNIFLALRFVSLYKVQSSEYEFSKQNAWFVVTHWSGVVPKKLFPFIGCFLHPQRISEVIVLQIQIYFELRVLRPTAFQMFGFLPRESYGLTREKLCHLRRRI